MARVVQVGFSYLSEHIFPTYEEVKKWAPLLAASLPKNSIVALYGNLGAGKTSLVKAIAPYFQIDSNTVNSPTFSYLHCYEGSLPIYHFDLYRLSSLEDFLELGFEEYFQKEGICFLEWPEIIAPILPLQTFALQWDFLPQGRKVILSQKTGE